MPLTFEELFLDARVVGVKVVDAQVMLRFSNGVELTLQMVERTFGMRDREGEVMR